MELLSQLWSLLGLLTVLQNLLPSQLLSLLHSAWQNLQESLTPYSYFDVPEFLGSSAVEPNDLYRHVQLYLHQKSASSASSTSLPRLTLSRHRGSPSGHLALSLSPGHTADDFFAGEKLLWFHNADTLQDSLEERRSFSLQLPKRRAAAILRPYLAHVSSAAKALAVASRERRLYTNRPGDPMAWASVPFHHPATFETLALDPELKNHIISDIDAFAAGREFYERTGRAWKRGYLLYGPPGTGKSSLIAAMANHLHYDVYDLELTKVTDNSELRSLLIQTTNRSIIVIEDIDCSLNLTINRSSKSKYQRTTKRQRTRRETESSGEEEMSREGRVTLSGLLNFTDGLWSCCGEERIVVFTTNYRKAIDPALLRAGRMDVHIQLGPCGSHALKEMIQRYVGEQATKSAFTEEAVELVKNEGVEIMPAEVGELLLRHRDNPEIALRELVAEMKVRAENGSRGEWWEEEREDRSPEGSCEGSPEAAEKEKQGGSGWERRVRFLGRLRSLTKSDSGRRGI